MVTVIAGFAWAAAAYLGFGVSAGAALRSEVVRSLPQSGRHAPAWFRLTALGRRLLAARTREQLAVVGRPVRTYVLQGGLFAALGAAALGLDLSWVAAPVGLALGLGINRFVLSRRYKGWLAEVVGNTADLVTFLKVRLLAGDTIHRALTAIQPQLPGALRLEWDRMLSAWQSGLPLRDALLALSDRVYDRDFAAVINQIIVYERDGVPDDPFQQLAAHITRIQLLQREYRVRRATSSIQLLNGFAFLAAGIAVGAPIMYLLWEQSAATLPL